METVIVAMETVKAAYEFLIHGESAVPADYDRTADIIQEFLCWPGIRVKEALANLRSAGEIDLEGKGESKNIIPIDRKIFEILPTRQHAQDFRQAVKLTKASPKVQKGEELD